MDICQIPTKGHVSCQSLAGQDWLPELLRHKIERDLPPVNQPMHYGNIFEYLSLWSEAQSLNIQKSKNSKNITNLDFTPETCQKIEKMLILNSRYRGIV